MQVFQSPVGDGTVYFDNLLTAGQVPVGYDPQRRGFRTDAPFCANRDVIGCNWTAAARGALCAACAMTALAPDLTLPEAEENWATAETAKRWVLDNLGQWGWFGPRDAGPAPVFHMLAEGAAPVVMGHGAGVVTINIAESDPVLRVSRREALDEPYRTMIGHMRHEISHMLWWRLSIAPGFLDAFRALFGDERADYAAALERHYAEGPPAGWQGSYLTAYAAAHPHEDWAETSAHLLHLIDIADSASAVGVSAPDVPWAGWAPYAEPDAERLVTAAAALALKLNHVNRAMGLADLYPFTLSAASREKLAFVHEWLRRGP